MGVPHRNTEGIHTNPWKIRAIIKWKPPTNVSKLRSFHGLATFYKRIIKGFTEIVAPLTKSLKKMEFQWEQEQQVSFDFYLSKILHNSYF